MRLAVLVATACWLALSVPGCSRAGTEAPLAGGCPAGFAPQPERLARLRALLAGDVEAERLLARAPPAPICFGVIESSSVARGAGPLLLDRAGSDMELAPRLAHLSHHLVKPLPERGGRTCAEWLAVVRAQEGEAHALEHRLRRRFGVPASPRDDLDALMEQYAVQCGGRP